MNDDMRERGAGPLSRVSKDDSMGTYRHADPRRSFASQMPGADEYARLHAEIEKSAVYGGCFVVGVTSAVYGEGKTTVAINLAGSIAEDSERRVALVDLNLRSCDLQMQLKLPPCVGMVDFLEGDCDLSQIVHRTESERLTIVPAGSVASTPGRLARSSRLAEAMAELRRANDYLIVDLAPVLPITDARLIGRHMDGFVMVVRAGSTPREIVSRAIDTLDRASVIGVILNRTEPPIPKWLQRHFVG